MAGTLVANTINTDTGLFSTNNAYSGIAKAWVTWNGSSNTVNGSFNVTSITKNTTGDYTINFTTALSNSTYSVTTSCGSNSTTNGQGILNVAQTSATSGAVTKSTTQLRVLSSQGSTGGLADFGELNVIVIGA